MTGGLEIERKFLIRMPALALLEKQAGAVDAIVQTYLTNDAGASERVRRRGGVYTHTVKRKLSDIVRFEDEREIDEATYLALLQRADPTRRPIEKTRYCLPWDGHLFEIDVFPFWSDRAFLEIELKAPDEPFTLPPQIEILREVTHDPRYTNSALAREVPEEEI